MSKFKNISIFLISISFYTTLNAQTSALVDMMKRSHELLMKETLYAGCEYIPSKTYVIKINSYACVKNAVICSATLKCAYSKNNIVTEYEEKANCGTDSNGKCPASANDCRKDEKVHEIYRGSDAISGAVASSATVSATGSVSGQSTSTSQSAKTGAANK